MEVAQATLHGPSRAIRTVFLCALTPLLCLPMAQAVQVTPLPWTRQARAFQSNGVGCAAQILSIAAPEGRLLSEAIQPLRGPSVESWDRAILTVYTCS